MIISIKWTSIIEAMVALSIVMIWITWLYTIYDRSQKLETATENRLKAISIAREWIEVLQNIRDTNWILFWADTRNCWNSLNYDINCLWDTTTTYKIWPWNYLIYKDADNRWKLISGSLWFDYTDTALRNEYRIKLDSHWLYTQSWWTNFNPVFTRVIQISYPEDTNSDSNFDANDEKMLIKSIVSWKDNTSKNYSTVTLENLLTNWKRN